MTRPEPGVIPLSTETVCPFCDARVVVHLVSASATAEVTAVRFVPEYKAQHRCRIQLPEGDPWADIPTGGKS